MGKAELEGLILTFLGATGPQTICDIRRHCQRNTTRMVTRSAVSHALVRLTAQGKTEPLVPEDETATHYRSTSHA